MNTFKKVSSIFFFSVVFACSKKSNPPASNPIVTPPVVVTPLITLPVGWKVASSLTSNFPSGMQLYSFDTIFNTQKIKAYCLAYNSNNTTIEFKPVLSVTAKTPSDFYTSEPGLTYACINGGFFGGNQSFSLVKYNNVVSSANIKSLTRVDCWPESSCAAETDRRRAPRPSMW